MDNCGSFGHKKKECRKLNIPGSNGTSASWAESIAGKAWKAAGFDRFSHKSETPSSLLVQPTSTSTSSADASTTHALKTTQKSSCKYAFMSSLQLSTFSTPADFLTATVSLQSQTGRQPAEAADRKEVEAGEGAKRTVQVLLDTGSLAGNFISQSIVTELDADIYVYRSKRSFSVWITFVMNQIS